MVTEILTHLYETVVSSRKWLFFYYETVVEMCLPFRESQKKVCNCTDYEKKKKIEAED